MVTRIGGLLYKGGLNLEETEVNYTTETFVSYYISALENIHYVPLELERYEYERREAARVHKAKGALPFEDLEKIKRQTYKRMKLEDLFRPNEFSTAFIKLFDGIRLPYFEEDGKLKHASPNRLINDFYEGLYKYGDKFILPDKEQEVMIVKGHTLIRKSRKTAHYSANRKEYEALLYKMATHFLRRLIKIGETDAGEAAKYFSAFTDVKMPALDFVITSMEGGMQDWEGKTRKRASSFGEILWKRLDKGIDGYGDYVPERENELYELKGPFMRLYCDKLAKKF